MVVKICAKMCKNVFHFSLSTLIRRILDCVGYTQHTLEYTFTWANTLHMTAFEDFTAKNPISSLLKSNHKLVTEAFEVQSNTFLRNDPFFFHVQGGKALVCVLGVQSPVTCGLSKPSCARQCCYNQSKISIAPYKLFFH